MADKLPENLNLKLNKPQQNSSPTTLSDVSKEERIGYHKGALNTLLAERNELLRVVSITESLIEAHLKELENLGVKIAQDQQKA